MIERKRFVDPLLYWAKERESIRLKRAAGLPPPWTDDPILRQYRFCNVRRLDDRVSQWLIKNVFPLLNEGMSRWTFVRLVALCRWVNWPPTIKVFLELDKPWHERQYVWQNGDRLDLIGNVIESRVRSGDKAWTGAYMVRAPSKREQACPVCLGSGFTGHGTGYGDVCSHCGGQRIFPITKSDFVTQVVVGNGLDLVQGDLMEALETNSAENVWGVLTTAKNWGSFMAGQVVADLTYTPLLADATDLNTWAPKGPGSVRGYNRLLGLPLKQKAPSNEVWCGVLQRWRAELIETLGPGYGDVNLMDLQNCLCETDKYLRVKAGEGRPRSTYKPETSY